MVLDVLRATDFPFSPETEAEFGGLKQNFQWEHDFENLVSRVKSNSTDSRIEEKTYIIKKKHYFGVKHAKRQWNR